MSGQRSVLLYGHRGASMERPENTMLSFERALAVGANALETDIHMTVDGHIVISHDPTGKRTAGVDREIKKTTLAELQTWDVGKDFVDEHGERPYAASGVRIPTLAELLETFTDVPINVDIKQHHRSIIEPLLALIREQQAEDRVTLASFSSVIIREVRARAYRGRTVLGQKEVLALWFKPLSWLRRRPPGGTAVQVPPRAGPIDFTTRRFVDKCHALGLRIAYWTINDPDEARYLLAQGADGIMTDDPAALAPLFAADTS